MTARDFGSESERLKALHRYEILDSAPEEAFDRITRVAKSVLGMPMVAVSLVDQDRQWFKSKQGFDATETRRDISFCTHTIQDTKPLIVRDALEDPRFANSPLVQDSPHIRFYAGVPLRTKDGHNIGALCSMDIKPRDLSVEQITLLQDLARIVVDELELRLLAGTDSHAA
jgi:GAF domain-containing protein